MSRGSSFAQYRCLLAKDLRQEFRTHEMLTSMGLYAVLVLIVYGATVASSATGIDILPVASGLFWAMLVFTSLLGLNRTFNAEKEGAAIEGLLLAPIDRSAIFLAKATANFLFLLVVEVICVPVFWFLFLADAALPADALMVALPLVVGAVGIAAVGTLLATITLRTRSRDVLLAILMIPIIFPLLYACVAATGAVLVPTTASADTFGLSLGLAAGYDAIMLIAAWALYGFVIEA